MLQIKLILIQHQKAQKYYMKRIRNLKTQKTRKFMMVIICKVRSTFQMKIGNLTFENNIFLAPMAGVTDISFRGLCKEMGCGLVYTEMVSAKALYYGSENTQTLLRIADEEKPVAVQIFGREPDIMANVCEEHFNDRDDICIIDINMGCPAPKIVKNGEGSALMKEPELVYEIVKAIKKVSKKPVTVKFRKGFDEDNINAVEFAKGMEQAGVDAITVHGRTRKQMYQGVADWNIIKAVKDNVSIPVIGNGDVFSGEDALRMKELTNCDGIMIARGSQGNPWIFKEVNCSLKGESLQEISYTEKIEMCLRHYELALKYDGEFKAIREMRKHASWYVKGLPRCTDIRNEINILDDSKKVIEILTKYKEELQNYILIQQIIFRIIGQIQSQYQQYILNMLQSQRLFQSINYNCQLLCFDFLYENIEAQQHKSLQIRIN
eukprot:TRINITY_DN11145_c0_g1_i4.p1 TRINITY_DN11145_c0_g1~~TRINITY_DN11145_c0_g1_i4.p1  ORF type:complete len:435 (+),score=66.88 TRINITY_DN11145_c0_g1_i4:1376-2680(+)